MSLKNNFFCLILVFFLYSCKCEVKPPFILNDNYYPTSYQDHFENYNIVGIVGDSTQKNSIEVNYYNYKTNKIDTLYYTPPCIIKGLETKFSFEVNTSLTPEFLQTECTAVRRTLLFNSKKPIFDYSVKNYYIIKNNSTKIIEYFIAGAQKNILSVPDSFSNQFTIDNLNSFYKAKPNISLPDNSLLISITPTIQYKLAPVYYLLYPNEIPNGTLAYLYYNDKSNINNIFNFNYKKIYEVLNNFISLGDTTINRPLNVDQVLTIYKNNSNTHLLTEYLPQVFINGNPTNLNNPFFQSTICLKYGCDSVSNYSSVKNIFTNVSKYYGVIPAKGSIQNSENTPLIDYPFLINSKN